MTDFSSKVENDNNQVDVREFECIDRL